MKIYKVTCVDVNQTVRSYEEYYKDRTDAEIERDRIKDELGDEVDDYDVEIEEIEVF